MTMRWSRKRAPGDAERSGEDRHHHRGRSLDVVVEGAERVPVALEQRARRGRARSPPTAAARRGAPALHRVHEAVHEVEVGVALHPLVPPADVVRLGAAGRRCWCPRPAGPGGCATARRRRRACRAGACRWRCPSLRRPGPRCPAPAPRRSPPPRPPRGAAGSPAAAPARRAWGRGGRARGDGGRSARTARTPGRRPGCRPPGPSRRGACGARRSRASRWCPGAPGGRCAAPGRPPCAGRPRRPARTAAPASRRPGAGARRGRAGRARPR